MLLKGINLTILTAWAYYRPLFINTFLSPKDVFRMNEPIRMYLKAGLNATQPEGQVTRLPHLLAKREVVTGRQMFEMEGSEPR